MFTWRFFTGGRPTTPVGRRCHRGPMTDYELLMSAPFKYLTEYNTLRRRLLDNIVDTTLMSVRTREVVLRCINGSNQAIFPRLYADKAELQARICEKKNTVDIYNALVSLLPFYISAANELVSHGLSKQYVQTIVAALNSNSPVVVVEGMCAVILWATFLEADTIAATPIIDPIGYGAGYYGADYYGT